MISYHDNVFSINGEDTFLWGGELHYFRVHKRDWKDRIQKIKDAGFNLISTYIPWMWHEPVQGQIDLTGETCEETDLVSFLQYVKDAGMYLLVRPGPYVMAETVNAGLPLWLIQGHPDIRARKENGDYHNNTGVVSYLHPTFLSHVKTWYDAVFQVLAPQEIQHGGPIVMTQYDNEVGMFHWITSQGDYSPTTMNYFENYLTSNHQSDLIDHLEDFLKGQTSKELAIQINQAYKYFFRTYIKTYLETLIGYAAEHGSTSYPVINVHGFSSYDFAKRGIRYPVGLSQLYDTRTIKHCVLAGDYYVGNIVSENYFDVILANAFTAAIQPEGQPLFSAEFQGGFQNGVPRLQPTTHDLKTRLTIAGGMNAINYYMFVGGENFNEIGLISRRHDWQAAIGMDGSLRRHYYVIKRIADVLRTYGDALLHASLANDTTLGFYPDYFMTEYNNHHTRSQANALTQQRQTYLFNGLGKSMAMNNITFDGLDLLKDEPIDVTVHPTLVMFSTIWMDERIQQKLVDYMTQGGSLFLFPKLPERDLNDTPCTILADAIGVRKLETVYQRVHIHDEDSVNCHSAEVYEVNDGYARLDLDHTKITGFTKAIGDGILNLFGMAIKSDWDYIDAIMKDVLALSNIHSPYQTEEWINILVRESNDGRFYFLHNFEEFEKQTTIVKDGNPLFDNHPITLPFRKGIILPEHWKVTNDFTLSYSTCEIHDKTIAEDTITLTLTALTDNERLAFEGSYEVVRNGSCTVDGKTLHIHNKGEHIITWIKQQ